MRVLPHVEGSTGRINLSYPLDWSIVRESDIASALLRMAEQGKEAGAGGCDLIAMATHGRPGVPELGSGQSSRTRAPRDDMSDFDCPLSHSKPGA